MLNKIQMTVWYYSGFEFPWEPIYSEGLHQKVKGEKYKLVSRTKHNN